MRTVSSNVICAAAGRNEETAFMRVAAKMLLALLFSLFSSSLFADELDDYKKEYATVYQETVKLVEQRKKYSPDSNNYIDLTYRIDRMIANLIQLKSVILRLGGDVIEIEQKVKGVKKMRPGSKIKLSLDGIETEYKTPDDYKPWPIPGWPNNARAMHEKDFIIRLRILEYSPTKWAKEKRREIEVWSTSDMNRYFLKLIKSMYIKDEGVNNWKQVLKGRKATPRTFFKDGEEFEADVERITKAWAVGNFKNEIIKDVFDDNGMGGAKSKLQKWKWLDTVLQYVHIRDDYEDAQIKLRRLLLVKKAVWDTESSVLWDGKISILQNIIIESERKLVWLLGYSDDKKFERLETAEDYKKTVLIAAQKELLKAYYPKRWYTLLNSIIEGMPASMDADPMGRPTGKKKAAKESVVKYNNLYKESEIALSVVKTTIKNGAKYGVMRSGVLRAIELGYPKLHLSKTKDYFYKTILGAEEYDRLKANFPVLQYTKVYKQFLPDPRDQANFEEQAKLRAPK